jgi:hypothetical protein
MISLIIVMILLLGSWILLNNLEEYGKNKHEQK